MSQLKKPRVYIGWDDREGEAGIVCRGSIQKRTTIDLDIRFLIDRDLRASGVYDRPFTQDGTQKIDKRDGRPFSTDFAFTRFLIPDLMDHEGVAIFCDADFLFLSDIRELLALFDPAYAVQVVKHKHVPIESRKMDGVSQAPYLRKNWSSLVMWNCAHPRHGDLTRWMVNHQPGGWLHAFSWLADYEIGELPLSWNWLSGVSDPIPQHPLPNAVHFTLGGPWFNNCAHHPFGDLWLQERERMNGSMVNTSVFSDAEKRA